MHTTSETRPHKCKRLGLPTIAVLGLAALLPTATRAQTQDLFVSNQSDPISRFAATGPGTFSTTATTLTGVGLSGPGGLVFDAQGDLFAANIGNTTITMFGAGATPGTFGATSTLSGGGLYSPEGLAFDAQGDLFVANGGTNSGSITEFAFNTASGTFGAGTVALTGGSLNFPYGLAFDAQGDLFVANLAGGTITEFAAGAMPGTFGVGVTFATGLSLPAGLAFDAQGDLFVANNGTNSITEFAFNTAFGTFGAGLTFATGLNGPAGLAFDARGDLFAANLAGGTITEFGFNTASGTFGAAQTVETGLSRPTFLAFGPSVSPVLASLTFASSVPGGTVVTATVTLSGPAQANVVVGLSSSDSSIVRLHRAVIVPAGSSSATFAINTYRSHTTKTVTIQATLGAVTQTGDLTITGR